MNSFSLSKLPGIKRGKMLTWSCGCIKWWPEHNLLLAYEQRSDRQCFVHRVTNVVVSSESEWTYAN